MPLSPVKAIFVTLIAPLPCRVWLPLVLAMAFFVLFELNLSMQVLVIL